MSIDSELLISINADAKGVKSAYEDVTKQTEDLTETLNKIAEVSAVAFAAMSAQVLTALDAFNKSDQATKALTQSIQNQGIYTDDLSESYKEQADQVQKLTGFSAVQVTQAQAVLQSQIGQIPITQKLTNAVADLAQKQGVSLPAAAEELGRAIGNGTGQLIRMGLSFSATDTQADRLQKTLAFVELRAGGMAAAANTGVGSIRGLESAFEDTQIQLGEKFAPAATAAIHALTDFIAPAKDANGEIVNLKAGLLAVGLVLSGLGIALPLVAQGFLAVRAAAIALEISAGALIAIPAAIAIVVVAITELALHWGTVTAQVKAIVTGLVTFVSESFSGLGKVLQGAFYLDSAKIKEGLDQIKASFGEATDSYKDSLELQDKAEEKHVTTQDAAKKAAADKEAATRKANEANRIALVKAQDDLIELEIQNASVKVIDLKKEEIAELTALTNKKQGRDKDLLTQQLADTKTRETAAIAEEVNRTKAFDEIQIKAKGDLAKKSQEFSTDIDKKEIAKIKSTTDTEGDIKKKAYAEQLALEIKAHNTFLAEQNKYGTAYAAINQFIHSSEIQGFNQASTDLAQLTQSKNETLKTIGKVFAIENIIIKTAESAMNIYAGFSAIPIIGPELGLAGAAAAVAFGAEQIETVGKAATGGIVGGTGTGDSQHYMLEPGEFITPTKNYDETVNAVADARNAANGAGTGGLATVQLSLKDGLMDFIEAKLVQRKALNFSIQGSR